MWFDQGRGALRPDARLCLLDVRRAPPRTTLHHTARTTYATCRIPRPSPPPPHHHRRRQHPSPPTITTRPVSCALRRYARHWIRQFISRAVANNSRMIRLPARVHEKVQAMSRVATELQSDLGRGKASGAELGASEPRLCPEASRCVQNTNHN